MGGDVHRGTPALAIEVEAASEQVWGVGYSIVGGVDIIFTREDPTGLENSHAAFEHEIRIRHLSREADLLYTFGSSAMEQGFLKKYGYLINPSDNDLDEDIPF